MRAKPGRGISVQYISIIAIFLCAPAGFAATIYVDDDAPNDPSPGNPAVSDPLENGTADHPFDAIQEGIDCAVPGGTVLVEDGTYTGAGNRNLDLAGKAITLRSFHGPEQCIIDCQGAARGFTFSKNETSSTVVDGFTITRGLASQGAGVYCKGSSPSLVNCILTLNGSSSFIYGGGIYLENSSAEMTNCTLTRNQTGEQTIMGGIYAKDSNPKVLYCTIADNVGGGIRVFRNLSSAHLTLIGCNILRNQGLGVLLEYSGFAVTDCLIAGNIYDGWGGGVQVYGAGDGTIDRCQIFNNQGKDGGGIALIGAGVDISNSIIAGNSATEWGGGIYFDNGSNSRIRNCTITDNCCPMGSAIYEGSYNGRLTMINSILWGNVPKWNSPSGEQVTMFADVYTAEFSAESCDIQGGQAGVVTTGKGCIVLWKKGNIDSLPQFQNTALRDYHLTDASPCVDHGVNDPNTVNMLDIDGCPRPLGASMDIGADEHDFGKSVIHTTTKSMEFIWLDTQPDVPPLILSLRNGGSVPLTWRIESIPTWLSVEPAEGQSTGEWDSVQVHAHREGLAYGRYDSTIQIVDSGAVNSPVVIPVVFFVEDGYRHVPSMYPTIQEAIDAAVPGEQVVIAPGTYRGPGNRDLDFKGKAITVRSQDPQDKSIVEATILDCQGLALDQHRGFNFQTGEGLDSVVDGLTIINGYIESSADGGGIVTHFDCTPTIRGCIFRYNRGGSGGALVCVGSKAPEILDCIFERNTSTKFDGGAIFAHTVNLRDCVFRDNIAQTSGGAISLGQVCTVDRCVFEGNRSINGYGGAVGMQGTLSNCLIVGNYSKYGGGAIYVEQNLTVLRCTIAHNRSGKDTGGIVIPRPNRFFMTDSILWGNTNPQLFQETGGIPLSISYCDIDGGFEGKEVYNLDPEFVKPGTWKDNGTPNNLSDDTWVSGDYHLKTDSPCIDAGDPKTDFSNEPQPNGGRVNLGSYGNTAEATVTVNSDEDGYSDPQEIRWGLDPYRTDSDGDGLSDRYEVGYDGDDTSYESYDPMTGLGTDLNAVSADTDEDGISDFDELNQTHTDPLRFDFTGKTLFVDDDAPGDPGPNDPTVSDPVEDGSTEHPFDTLQEAVAAAVNGYVISIADGLYRLPTGLNCGKKSLSICSQNGPDNCILDASGSQAGIEFNAVGGTGAVLEGLTIRNAGVGIRSTNTTLVIRDCIVRNNGQGGVASVVLNQGAVSVIGCRIVGNQNTGISSTDGLLTVSHCVLSDNGGTNGISLTNSKTTIENCLIVRNSIPSGRAVYCGGTSEVQIRNCTIAGNSRGIWQAGKSVVIRNSILWNEVIELNTASGVTAEYCDIKTGFAGTGNRNANPMFAGGGDYHLLDGSPCIDAGDPQTTVGPNDTDLDGERRILYGRIDMGCYETILRDFTADKQVDLSDLVILVSHWMESGCTEPLWCGGVDMTFDGLVGLDDVSVFAERWLQVESSSLFALWAFDGDLDEQSWKLIGTALSDPAFVDQLQAKVGTGAVELDGNDAVVVNGFAGITGTHARTCMAWIKTTGTVGPIVYWGDKNTAGALWDLRVGSLGQLRLVAGSGPVVDGATKVNTGEWVHVAAVLPEGGNSTTAVQLYVNGVRETETVTAGAINTKALAAFRIGTNENGNYFTGLIDDVRIFDRALTAEEIAEVAE
jgi:predicted outer membrane repeat protein